jgi:hypothetical protein
VSSEKTATATARAEGEAAPVPTATGRTVARNTAIFSVLTGLSRIAGLIREIVASSYFATSGAFSAFTIAFQVPNVVRSLFADASAPRSCRSSPSCSSRVAARRPSGSPRRCSS